MNNTKFYNLIELDLHDLTHIEKQFVSTHKNILRNGTDAVNSLLEMSEHLKEMKDEEYYKAANFKSFKEYVEHAVGIKERQAYNYIKVYEEYDKEFLHSNAKIGITKLSLLATVSNEERELIIENTNLEDTSVKELKEKIKELENAKEQLENKSTQLELDLENRFNDHRLTDGVVFELEVQKKLLLKDKEKLLLEIEELKTQQTNEVIKEVFIESEESTEELIQTKKILEDKEKLLSSLNYELETLRKELKTSDKNLLEFKILFNNFQNILNEMFNSLSKLGENKSSCKDAIISVLKEYELYE